MDNFEFCNPTKIIFGRGTEAQVGKEAAVYSKKVLLHFGGGSIKSSGLYDRVIASLKAAGLLTASTTATQAEEALQKLRAYGWEPESNDLHASLAAFEVAPAVAVTFANSLSRASVKDHLCGFSYAATAACRKPR